MKAKYLVIYLFSFLLTACGFHFKTGELLPVELRTMHFQTADPYGEMSRIMRQTMRLNAIKLVDDQQNVPVFYLGGLSQQEKVAALFSSGKEAEKVMVFGAHASVTLPNGERYPLSARVVQSFFDSPEAALAKATEKDALWNEMRTRVAQQLINRLFALKDKLPLPAKNNEASTQ